MEVSTTYVQVRSLAWYVTQEICIDVFLQYIALLASFIQCCGNFYSDIFSHIQNWYLYLPCPVLLEDTFVHMVILYSHLYILCREYSLNTEKILQYSKKAINICFCFCIQIFTLPSLKPFCKFKLTAHEGARVRRMGIARFTTAAGQHSESCLVCLTNLGDCIVLSVPELRRQLNAAVVRREDIKYDWITKHWPLSSEHYKICCVSHFQIMHASLLTVIWIIFLVLFLFSGEIIGLLCQLLTVLEFYRMFLFTLFIMQIYVCFDTLCQLLTGCHWIWYQVYTFHFQSHLMTCSCFV
jgi:hypothetical protein